MMLSEIIGTCVLILTVVVAVVSLVLTMEYIKKNQYMRRKNERDEMNVARIDSYREYFEDKIYTLQKELLANERRWADVNHLIVSGQTSNKISPNNSLNDIQFSSSFFKTLGISADQLILEKKSVFVLTPFSDEGTQTYDIIKKICGDVDLKCSRGDEIYHNDNILSHIIRSILQANIIIANVDGRNPNVFYELGICHVIGKPVIIVSHLGTTKDLPFDIKAKNIIFYSDKNDLQIQLKNELLKAFIGDVNNIL